MKAVVEMVRELPTKVEVDELNNYVKKRISDFDTDNRSFKMQFKQHLEIIRRYD